MAENDAYRLSFTSRSHGTIQARWIQGLQYYAPLTDVFGTPVNSTTCNGRVYGLLGDRQLNWAQNSGTIANNMRAYYRGGHSGVEIDSSGNNSRLDLPPSSTANLVAPMTVAGWARIDDVGGAGAIASKSQGTTRNYTLGWDNTNVFFSFTVSSSFKSALAAISNVTTGMWTHWVGTYDKVAIRLYKNGVQIASQAETGNNDGGNTAQQIGNLDASALQSRACAIRQVAAWTGRCLSPTEVGMLYNTPTLFEDYHSGMSPQANPIR